MTLAPPFTTWKDPPLPAEFPGGIRLVDVAGSISFYQASVEPVSLSPSGDDTKSAPGYPFLVTLTPTVLSGGTPTTTISIAQPLGTTPAFDIIAHDDGSLSAAVQAFGGATNALVVGTAGLEPFSINATYRGSPDYGFPRFMRGDGPARGQSLTAILDDGLFVALNADAKSGKSTPYVKLADASAGVALSLSGSGSQATALFFKSGNSGPPLLAGDFLGTLMLAMASNGRPSGKPQALLAQDGTYTFDVDAQSGLALILASTSTGPQLLSCDLTSGKTLPIAWPSGYPASDTWIASPSVLALPGSSGSTPFAIAFIEGGSSGVTGIRYAELDLSASSSSGAAVAA